MKNADYSVELDWSYFGVIYNDKKLLIKLIKYCSLVLQNIAHLY